MKKIFAIIFAVILTLVPFVLSRAQDSVSQSKTDTTDKVTIYFFRANGCPHCADEEPFLEEMAKKYPQVQIKDFEVTTSRDNANLLKKVGEKMGFDVTGVPVTVIGKYNFTGWTDRETTGKQIEEAINCAIAKGCTDVVGEIQNQATSVNQKQIKVPDSIKIPIVGQVSLKNLSLPAITVILGLVDGFNPCSLWTLVFLLTLLVSMGDRWRMWILGGAFILASAVVYFLAMTALLKVIIFFGFIIWIRIAIGGTSLVTGFYNIRSFFDRSTEQCKVSKNKRQLLVLEKLKSIAQKPQFWLALIGIMLLAGAVNLFEMLCSIGLPTIFNQILAINNLSRLQYYLYIFGYIFFYELNAIIVFLIAMIALKTTALGTKYVRFLKLAGGVVMIIIGILMIVKPEWLMMG